MIIFHKSSVSKIGLYIWLLTVLLLATFFISAYTTEPAKTPQQIRELGSALWLFVDDWLIDRMTNVQLKLHTPERKEVVFVFDAPWEGVESGYITMMQDENKYRMYYRGGGELSREYTCLAESNDGIRWTRPSLGLFEFKGSKDNNIIWTGERPSYCDSHNFAPFKDTNPEVAPEARYKAVALNVYADEKNERRKMLFAFVSSDGIHWKRLQDKPIISDGSFDSLNVAFWDSARGYYVCYFRAPRESKRSIKRAISRDFINWTDIQWLDFGSTPLENLYTNGITPYYRAQQLLIGLPMRFVPERKTIGIEQRQIDGVSDAVLITSYDGIHWSRYFMEAFIRPGLEQNNWGNAHGNNTPAWGILPTGENEISIYWAENYGKIPHLRRGTLRPDGFVSVNAPYKGGEMITKPLTFSGKNLCINYSTSAVGSIKVEIQDINGKAINGFTLDEAIEIYGDEISCLVTWKSGADVSSLSGKPVRLRFVMHDADLYSLRFN